MSNEHSAESESFMETVKKVAKAATPVLVMSAVTIATTVAAQAAAKAVTDRMGPPPAK